MSNPLKITLMPLVPNTYQEEDFKRKTPEMYLLKNKRQQVFQIYKEITMPSGINTWL
jgi:hypothetical protein